MKPFIITLSVFATITLTKSVSSKKVSSKDDQPYVQTPLGGIIGSYDFSYKGRSYALFQSVPYALPPTGERRFEPPHPVKPWPKAIEALNLPEACLQYNSLFEKTMGQEDCLYLNVYVPKTKKKSLPVLFWIPGGGFQYGYSSAYRAKYLMDRDLILVTVNYRLNAFGFLSTGDEVVPGNMGLKDQNLALQWVNENIKYFGGDSEKITLAGVSAGGASVQYHYLSPISRGLFQNGISFSGSALSWWAHVNNSTEVTKTLANGVNCTTANSADMVDCLKKVSAVDINTFIESILHNSTSAFALFPPVTENTKKGYFINKSPRDILNDYEAYDVPWIVGVVEDDGLFVTGNFILNDTAVAHMDQNWDFYAPRVLDYLYHKSEIESAEIAVLAKQYYFAKNTFNLNTKNLTRLIGDSLIVVNCVRAAKLQAKVNKSPVWFYHYTYRAAQSLTDTLTNSNINLGVSHDDDIYLVLENDYIDPTTTASDRAMLEEMLDFWYSVVKQRKPNLGVDWEPLADDTKDFRFMNIAGPNNYKMKMDNNFREINFWSSIGL